MPADLKLEIFAYDIFQTVFLSHRLLQYKPSVFEIYGDECFGALSNANVYDDLFHKAIFCRRELFQIVYKSELMYEKIESCKSPSDLFDYLINRCDQDYLFHNLNVFERMFSTCAFVVSMCVHIYWYNVVDVIRYGHLFWAIFFDKYTEEFYREGGWNELKRVAKTYDLLYEFLALFPENFDNYFRAMKEATVNYRHFKEVAFSTESNHVSKTWVRFRIKNLGNHVRIPVSYETSLNPMKTEFLLEELKQFCDPRSKEGLKYSEQLRDGGSKLKCFNGFASTTDNSGNSVDDSDSDNISPGRSRDKSFIDFVSDTDTDDSSRSVDDSDSDDMPQEKYQRSGFSDERASGTCAEIQTADNDPSIELFLLAHKNRIFDKFSCKISNSFIKQNKKLRRKKSVLNSEVDAFDHLLKNKILEYEEKTFKEKTLRKNPSELALNKNVINKHNIFAVGTMSQLFEPTSEKSSNTEDLDFGYRITNCDLNPDNGNEICSVNNINSRNATRHRAIVNIAEETCILAKQRVEYMWEAKSPPKNPRTQNELNLVNVHTNINTQIKNTEEIGNAYSDSRNGEINETVKPMNVLFTDLNTKSEWNAWTFLDVPHNSKDETINTMLASEWHGKTSPNIVHNSAYSNLLKETVGREDKRKIIQRKLDIIRNESTFNPFSRTLLKSEDMEGIGYEHATLFTKEEMFEYSSESLQNLKKRTGSEQEASRKKFSPERKEV